MALVGVELEALVFEPDAFAHRFRSLKSRKRKLSSWLAYRYHLYF